MRPRRQIATAIAALLVAACSSAASDQRFVEASGQLPSVHATTLTGATYGPRDYQGQVLILNFWNQACPPCVEEVPTLAAASEALSGRGVVILGVLYTGGGWPDDPAAARAFLDSRGVAYQSIEDPSLALATALGVLGIPTTVAVDRTGAVRFKLLGRLRAGELEDLVDRLE